MTHGPSRRATLLAAAGGALALPVICSGSAHAATPAPPLGTRELPIVTHPRDAGAVYAPDAARHAHAEPLNAAVGCALGRGGRG
ncbi:hypothetical protein [Streptomyces sp. V3I7]|uniref:hypothetical protein n=1 Tax=Streptomyces sp. V3I7 TaxID=3042278 RepID=UPI002781FD88|nr:hypothetical protein [Streptomyces sp. V3I7]MDQ0989481.1 hypothetical protein [Streptomyces sp. V3I7]